MMKWCSLQLNLMPVIAMETDAAIEKLQQLIDKVSTHGYAEDIDQLNAMRKSILKRIQSLDRFCQNKYHDESVDIFHMLKLKLQKAVFKIKHINNETISSQTIANMFADSEYHKIKQQKQSKSPKKNTNNQNQTFNQSNRDLFDQESRHQDLFYMPTGNTSFDFGFHHHDQPLFKRSRSRQSPSTPQLRIKNFKKSKQKPIPIKKLINTQQQHISNKKLPQVKQTSNVSEKIRQNLVEDKDQSFRMSKNINKKIQSIQQKNIYNVSKNSYQQVRAIQKQRLNHEKSVKNINQIKNKASQRIKTVGNQGSNISSNQNKLRAGVKGKNTKSKQLIKQEWMEQKQTNQMDENQFRFTIKMTKQEYLSLQALRQELIKSGQLNE